MEASGPSFEVAQCVISRLDPTLRFGSSDLLLRLLPTGTFEKHYNMSQLHG
jgi:hypothetical protein